MPVVKRVYVAKVHGEYICQRGRDRVLRSYEATFRLPDASAPLAMIKGKLLMPFLRKLDAEVVAPYSWHLDELRPENGEFDPDALPVIFQSFAQLKQYCIRHNLDVPVEEYADLDMCRTHVMVAKEDPAAFQKIYAKYKTVIEQDRALEDLNNGFEGIGQVNDEVKVDAETGKLMPKVAPGAPAAPASTEPGMTADELFQ